MVNTVIVDKSMTQVWAQTFNERRQQLKKKEKEEEGRCQ